MESWPWSGLALVAVSWTVQLWRLRVKRRRRMGRRAERQASLAEVAGLLRARQDQLVRRGRSG